MAREIGVKPGHCAIIEGKRRNVESNTKKKRNCQQYKIVLRGEVR